KGMTEKARAGMYPSFAPIGYQNVDGPDGKRVITPDTDAPTITRLFELFATGQHSLKGLARLARAEGCTRANSTTSSAKGSITATSIGTARPTRGSTSRS